ncbi:MAG TPA: hypothetical protein VKT77_18125 [Chthonomonadaceae bacterium]|nr:hypothetical protein [Chthonomonadaceae bacterium]
MNNLIYIYLRPFDPARGDLVPTLAEVDALAAAEREDVRRAEAENSRLRAEPESLRRQARP